MENAINEDAPLDYVKFQLFPNHDRYEACACSGDAIETVASGDLGKLVLHVPELKDLLSKGSKSSFLIQHPENLDSSQWFTKATITRFLHIVGSMDILNTTTSILSEISQLEEAKKFHLSLYTKDESKTAPTDASKNELLRAMKLRLTTLKTELAIAFNRAAGNSCFPKHICNMEKLAQHLGDINLRNTLEKFVELSPVDQKLPMSSTNDSVDKSNEKTEAKKSSALDTPVKYGVSPAKAAQIERQSSTESEKSSDSSEGEQQSVERSRSLARSASPRRSASPMRRVQIGRSGSRRAAALTIKSLNYFPGRDKTQPFKDAYSSEEEGSEKPIKKSDNNNALRISVKDAISLFENKQKDHTSNAQKKDASVGANKSVLRRWSAGVGDQESVSESSSQFNSENVEVEIPGSGMETKTVILGDDKDIEDDKVDEILHSIQERMSKPIDKEPDILVIEHEEEDDEKLTASAEWNRKKEAELNEMLTKMMQTKPSRNHKKVSDNALEKRGGFYDQYKGKRDEKLRGETTEKRAEKEAQFRAMQQVLEQRKSAMASASATGVTRSKSSLSKPEKLSKSLTPPVSTKKESPKPVLAKKAPTKASPSPIRRSPRASTSPAKTPSSGTTPTQRKPKTGPTGPQSSPKVEKPLVGPKPKPVKASTETNTRKSTKGVTEKQREPSVLKQAKVTKVKALAISEKESLKDVAKPSFYNKVTKKSTVVPLESKPFLRKGTNPAVKTKASPQPKEPVQKPEVLIAAEEDDVASQHIPQGDIQSEDTRADIDSESQLTTTQQVCGETMFSETAITISDDSLLERSASELKTEAEEDITISPAAWVEVEDHDDVKCKISPVVNVGPVAPASPRIRHSLSQMLLEESAEVDNAEWGNAEIPPSIVYQKDAPKGLKKLLRDFAGPQRSYAQSNSNNFGSQNSSKRLQDHISGSATSTKATRSFFSLSALRGNKPNETKIR